MRRVPPGAAPERERPTGPAHGARPAEIFDRETEWDALVSFATDPRPGATLGVVRGRRRQGKTYLLESLTRALGGFYFAAQEAAEAESLHRLGDELAQYSGVPRPGGWRHWDDALEALLALGDERPVPVVVDEFPELVQQSPGLPSALSNAYRRIHETRPGNRARLLLSGNVMTVMGRLFTGPSPLHGLTGLNLVIRPLDFRQAARFWGAADPRLALLVHSVVGGTPAYRRHQVCDDAPAGPEDFDSWVCRTVLNPRMPLYWEARHLMEEEQDHWDRALCHSALAAIAAGCATRGTIAGFLDRPVTDVTRALALLQDRGLLHSEPDAFRPSLRRYRITEPLLAFDHAVARPHRSALEQQDAAEVWRRARPLFDSAVAGPHFAQVCRDWAVAHAAPGTFGGVPASATHGSLPDPAHGGCLDAEVVVRGQAGTRSDVPLSVGLAHWGEVMDTGHLERLRRILDLLAARGEDVTHLRPACYGGAGFTAELRAAEARGDVVLVDLDRLYHGA